MKRLDQVGQRRNEGQTIMVQGLNERRNWAQWAKGFRLAISIPFCLVGVLLAIVTLPMNEIVLTLASVGIIVLNLLEVLGALRARVEIRDSSIFVQGLWKSSEINFEDILGMETDRWDGGFYFIAFGPRNVRVINLLVVDPEDEDDEDEIELSTAFAPKRRIAELEKALKAHIPALRKSSDSPQV